MTLSRRRLLTITAGASAGLLIGSAQAQTHQWRGIALGAEVRLIFSGLGRARSQALFELVRKEIDRLEQIFSLYRPGSALSQLNKHGFLANPQLELLAVLSLTTTVHVATHGSFDPSIQPIWKVYAMHQGKPPEVALAEATQLVDWNAVRFNSTEVRFEKPGMALTLNGIAQGYITDAVAQLLHKEGIENAVVSAGETATLGDQNGIKPWRIGIATREDETPQEFVFLSNRAIATSAATGSTIGSGGPSHIISPKTGRPCKSQWVRVSVMHKSAALADALSTAFVQMSTDEIKSSIALFDGATVIAKDNDGRSFRS